MSSTSHVKDCLYILDRRPFPDTLLGNIVSLSVGCHFTFWDTALWSTGFLILMKFNLSTLLLCMLLQSDLRNGYLIQGHKDLLIYLLLHRVSSSTVVALMFKSILRFYYIYSKVSTQLHSFTCRYPVILSSFVGTHYCFPSELYCYPCWRSMDHKCQYLFLYSESYSIGLQVCPHARTT